MDVRPAAMLVALGLLVASSVAFVMTQREKLSWGPIADALRRQALGTLVRLPQRRGGGRVPPPRARHGHRRDLRRGGTSRAHAPSGRACRQRPCRVEWDGETNAGALAADGRYQAGIGCEREGRRLVVPTSIELDATAPTATLVSALPGVGGAGRAHRRPLPPQRARPGDPLRRWASRRARPRSQDRGQAARGSDRVGRRRPRRRGATS